MNKSYLRISLFCAAVIFGALSVFLNPQGLAALGIMDASLAHENPLVRASALFEIKVARIACGVLSIVFLLSIWLWPNFQASGWYQRYLQRDLAPPAAYEMQLRQVLNLSFFVLVVVLCLLLVYLNTGRQVFSYETLLALNKEDGFFETVSAIILLIAAVLAIRVAAFKTERWAQRGMYLFLALLFFVMCGEEISWGQRYLGFQTPEAIKNVNVQGEINFHNMFGYFFDHLFILCFFLWGCVVPVIYRFSPFFRQVFRAISLPVASAGLAIGMLLITLSQEQIVYRFSGGLPGLRLPELREFCSAIAFLLMMIESHRYLGRPKS